MKWFKRLNALSLLLSFQAIIGFKMQYFAVILFVKTLINGIMVEWSCQNDIMTKLSKKRKKSLTF